MCVKEGFIEKQVFGLDLEVVWGLISQTCKRRIYLVEEKERKTWKIQ